MDNKVYAYQSGKIRILNEPQVYRDWLKESQDSILRYVNWNNKTLDNICLSLKEIDCEEISIDGTLKYPLIRILYRTQEDNIIEYLINRNDSLKSRDKDNFLKRVEIKDIKTDINYYNNIHAY